MFCNFDEFLELPCISDELLGFLRRQALCCLVSDLPHSTLCDLFDLQSVRLQEGTLPDNNWPMVGLDLGQEQQNCAYSHWDSF